MKGKEISRIINSPQNGHSPAIASSNCVRSCGKLDINELDTNNKTQVERQCKIWVEALHPQLKQALPFNMKYSGWKLINKLQKEKIKGE